MSRQIIATARHATRLNSRIILVTLFALSAMSILCVKPASAQTPGILAFDLEISARRLANSLNTTTGVPVLRVRQGQTTALNWTTDEATQIFLQAYGQPTAVTPRAPGTLKFKATVAGRFAVVAHGFAGREVLANGNVGIADEQTEVVHNALASLADTIVSEIAAANGGAPRQRQNAQPTPPEIVFIPPTAGQIVLLYIEVLPR